MKSNKGFIGSYKMLDFKKIKKSEIRKSVRNKLEDEVIIMKTTKLKKFAIVGTILAVTLISFTTVNAATDGAVIDKIGQTITSIRIKINGEEVDVPIVVEESDDVIKYKIDVPDEDEQVEIEYEFEVEVDEDDSSVEVEIINEIPEE